MTQDSTRPNEKASNKIVEAGVDAISNDQDSKPGIDGLAKVNSHQSYLAPHSRPDSPDTLSILSADDLPELRLHHSQDRRSNHLRTLRLDDEKDHTRSARWKRAARQSWVRNKGVALVLISQLFAVTMNISTRLLERGTEHEPGMDPLQILFVRMSITFTLAMIYMWYAQVEHYPFGAPNVRILLVARGVGGFFGVFGFYWSLEYLPLADATVLSFLGPPLACYVCSKVLKQPYTRTEQIAALVSLAGVVLIARPAALFSTTDKSIQDEKTTPGDGTHRRSPDAPTRASPHQRLLSVGMAMVGVLGAAVAYTTIRWIGKRAHPFISVNYFAMWCTIVSGVALVFVPSVPFVLPRSMREWLLLFFLGTSGFIFQVLLTAGLAYEKSSRANNMIYVQMILALAADLGVWGQVPSPLSICGSALILGGAVVVAVQKVSVIDAGEEARGHEEESVGLMHDTAHGEQEHSGDANIELGAMPRTDGDERGG